MRILRGALYRHEQGLARPLTLQGCRLESRTHLYLELQGEDGVRALGEIAPLPGFSVESTGQAQEAAARWLADAAGRDIHALLSELAHASHAASGLPASVRFGVSCALETLRLREMGEVRWPLFRTGQARLAPLCALLWDEPGRVLQAADEALAKGYRALKLKVGRGGVEDDARLVCALARQIGPEIELRLDANRAWSYEAARRFARLLGDTPLAYLEEPLEDPSRLPEWAAETRVPVALDETLQEWVARGLLAGGRWPLAHTEEPNAELRRLLECVRAVVIKPTLMGALGFISSLCSTLEQSFGIRPVFSSSFESRLGLLHIAHAASAFTREPIPIGLDTESWLGADPIAQPLPIEHGALDLAVTAAWLDRLDYAALREVARVTNPSPFALAAQRWPGAPAWVTHEGVYSYADGFARARSLACGLRALGVLEGDVLAILGEPSVDYLGLLMACFECGAVACPVNPRWPEATIDAALRALAPKALVVLDPAAYARPGALSLEDLAADDAVPHGHAFSLRQAATLVFTSGSTGEPKAALLRYENHHANALLSNANIAVGPGDRWLLSLPLYHVSGLAILFRCLAGGGAVVLPEPDEPLERALARYAVTHVSLVATQLYRLIEGGHAHTLRGLKAILIGGSAIPDELIARAQAERLPIHTSYGLTETASQVATTVPGGGGDPALRAAPALDPKSVRIGAGGQIEVSGPTLFEGYLVHGALERPVTEDGWYPTGDLGFLDEHGYLHVTGRKDNRFVCAGENVQPEAIERALCAVPGVMQAVVVPREDPEYGARPVAFVQMKSGAVFDAAALCAALSGALPGYMMPVAMLPWPDEGAGGIKPNRADFVRLARELRNGT